MHTCPRTLPMQPRRRRDGPAKRGKELNRIALADELRAIEYWHDEYLKRVPDTTDEDAFNTRQRRRTEILGLLATEAPYCQKHSVRMICPKCIASSGGRRTTTKYKDRLSSWGKMGGRGRRKRFSPLWEDSESGRKKEYNAPQFAKLTPEEAKAMLTARGLPDSPVVRQLLDWVAELEKRPNKK
jgi:hypothetical protein